MSIPVFLSYPKPHNSKQEQFIEHLENSLKDRSLAPRTLGVNQYDPDAPLKAIRRLMLESNGMITVAFRRTHVNSCEIKKDAELEGHETRKLSDVWLTSPWCHIEPAMAFQIGLPIIVIREKGVVAEGLLEKGIVGIYLPEFSLEDDPQEYLNKEEWKSILQKWEGYVRAVVEAKGNPPKLY